MTVSVQWQPVGANGGPPITPGKVSRSPTPQRRRHGHSRSPNSAEVMPPVSMGGAPPPQLWSPGTGISVVGLSGTGGKSSRHSRPRMRSKSPGRGSAAGRKQVMEVTVHPAGLGEPIFDRLDADLAHALMGINAVKGVEIGAGFASIAQKGSEHRDEMTPTGFLSNNAGGVLGGISSGQDIVASIALKPTSSIRLPGRSIDINGNPAEVITTGRHDPCVGIRATPIAEAMMALVLIDHLLRDRGQMGEKRVKTNNLID